MNRDCLLRGEERPAVRPGKSIQWIDLSDERRSGARPSATRGRAGGATYAIILKRP